LQVKRQRKCSVGSVAGKHIHMWWVVLAFLSLWFTNACFGQTLRVRVVNARNERPLQNQRVSISGRYAKGSTESFYLYLRTDSNGEVEFELPKPAPAGFDIFADLDYARWYCTCDAVVTTEEIIQKGFVSKPTNHERTPAQPSVQPKPGEILFRPSPTPWWVRIFHPLGED